MFESHVVNSIDIFHLKIFEQSAFVLEKSSIVLLTNHPYLNLKDLS